MAIKEFLGVRRVTTVGKSSPTMPARAPVESISQRELEVLQMVAIGGSNQKIADEQVLSLGTVRTHLNRIYAKLDVHTRTAAILRARELDLLPDVFPLRRSGPLPTQPRLWIQ